MPSSKFNKRPVPKQRPAICASIPKPPPAAATGRGFPAAAVEPYCLPPLNLLCPPRLQVIFGWIDGDPALPPEQQPKLYAGVTSDEKLGDPPSWHAAYIEKPWELHAWVEWEELPGRCAVTLRLWHYEQSEDFVWDPVWYNPFAAFDTHRLTNLVIPWQDYRWFRATA